MQQEIWRKSDFFLFVSIESLNLLHLKCHFDDKLASRFVWFASEFLLRCVCAVWCGRQCECMAANKWVNAANLPYHSQLSTRVWNHCEEPSWPTKPNPICKIVPFHLISWNYFVCNVDSSVSFEHDSDDQHTASEQMASNASGTGERFWRWDSVRLTHTAANSNCRTVDVCMNAIYLIERAYCLLWAAAVWAMSTGMNEPR